MNDEGQSMNDEGQSISSRVHHVCGGEFVLNHVISDVRLAGRVLQVPQDLYSCDRCGEERQTPDQIDEARGVAAAAIRRDEFLLEPNDLRRIREKRLGVTGRQLEEALGLGAKTVVRWEAGRVLQSKAVDGLYRLLDAYPSTLRILAAARGYTLPATATCVVNDLLENSITIARSLREELAELARAECVPLDALAMIAIKSFVAQRPKRASGYGYRFFDEIAQHLNSPAGHVSSIQQRPQLRLAERGAGRTPPYGSETFAQAV